MFSVRFDSLDVGEIFIVEINKTLFAGKKTELKKTENGFMNCLVQNRRGKLQKYFVPENHIVKIS